MIKKLDWYIASKFLKTFFFVALIFTLISLVISFSEKVDNYIEKKLSAATVFYEFYLNFIPWINGLLWPLFGLIAVIFFTSKMASNSEIITSYSGGVSFYRFFMPYLACGLLLSMIHLVGNHTIIPLSNKKRVRFENKNFNSNNNIEGETRNIHLFLNKNTKIYIQQFIQSDSIGMGFAMETIVEGELKRELIAEKIELGKKQGTWRIINFIDRTIDKDGFKQTIQKGFVKDTILNFQIEDFLRERSLKDMMTSKDLKAFIASTKSKGSTGYKEMEIELYRRTSDAFAVLIMTVIGFTIASRKVRGGIGLHLAMGAFIGAIFIIMSKFSTTFAKDSNFPLLGVWIPNILFILISFWLIKKAQK